MMNCCEVEQMHLTIAMVVESFPSVLLGALVLVLGHPILLVYCPYGEGHGRCLMSDRFLPKKTSCLFQFTNSI